MNQLAAENITGTQERVACDGNGGPMGHPRIFLSVGKEGKVVCPYCSREFVKTPA